MTLKVCMALKFKCHSHQYYYLYKQSRGARRANHDREFCYRMRYYYAAYSTVYMQLSPLSRHCNKTKKAKKQGLVSSQANARNVSFRISSRWPIHVINSVDKTKLSCNTPHRRSTTVSLETSLIFLCRFRK